MKTKTILTILSLAILFSCSKKNNDDQNGGGGAGSPEGISLIAGTLGYIPVIDIDANSYRYLHSVGGVAIYRSLTYKPYDFSQLAQDKDCSWKLEYAGAKVYLPGTGPGTLDGEIVSFRNKKKLTEWWGVGTTATPGGSQEYYLYNSEEFTVPSPIPDNLKFKLYFSRKKNGVNAYFIESVQYPGYFLTNVGHTLTANGVSLKNTITDKAEIEFH